VLGALKVNYTESLHEMTKSLTIYDQLIEVKRTEKDQLIQAIKDMKLELKHTKENTKDYFAVEQDLCRETHKIEKQFRRKNEECFFFEKEITEI
jgi:hypothetical protein